MNVFGCFDSTAQGSCPNMHARFSQNKFEKAMVLLEVAIETKNMNTDTHHLLAECHRKRRATFLRKWLV